MSEENVELALRMVEWFNTRDAAAAQAHSTDDVEVVPLRAAMESTSYAGPNAFAAFLTGNAEVWEDPRFELEEMREAHDRVVVIGRVSARARKAGADVDMRIAVLYEFEGDRVRRVRTYVDVGEALEAAGLSE